jgi:glutamate formiminotransferase / 5-formyltetrahydrofolate cyclo-ligase
VLECVPNVSEGRDPRVLVDLASACSGSLLDLHTDPDHHRSVFTLAGPGEDDAASAVRDLARAVAARVELGSHDGVHPRFGALDVAPFVALSGTAAVDAADAARSFAAWVADELRVPVFLFGDSDEQRRTLPDLRRDAFAARAPDLGPREPHPTLGAVAVGARPVLVAVNCELDRDDFAVARAVARAVRERDGGLPGVRALGLPLPSRSRVQVSMNLVDLQATGLQHACETVRAESLALDCDVARVELVGLIPESELARCDDAFRAWARITPDQTIEAQLALRFA